MNQDIETRLRHEAQRQPLPLQSALAERILARTSAPHADLAPLPWPEHRFRSVPFAIAAAIIAAITLGILAMQSHPTPTTPGPAPVPVAALPPAPSAPTLALPAIEWTSPWTFTVANPLNTELVLLEEDLRSASRFLTDRLPFQAQEMN